MTLNLFPIIMKFERLLGFISQSYRLVEYIKLYTYNPKHLNLLYLWKLLLNFKKLVFEKYVKHIFFFMLETGFYYRKQKKCFWETLSKEGLKFLCSSLK